ncbi:MAG TPA: NAD(P)H-binding protein [Sphingomicrobium sp.]|nr:NAD(P)H-binding protein [Sphingomicrobium sp.]
MRIALIGGTGLVGSRLVPLLREEELLLLTRRPIRETEAPQRVGPAGEWPAILAGERLDAAVSALGTTWRKAGSWDVFEQIDRHHVLGFAKAAKAAGARQFVLVSSVGADPKSKAEYLAIKGRVEEDLKHIGFNRLDILRPGLLRGPRGGDRRLKERLGIALSPLTNLFLRGSKDRFAAVDAVQVASAIAALLGEPEPGAYIHHNREIRRLASS